MYAVHAVHDPKELNINVVDRIGVIEGDTF